SVLPRPTPLTEGLERWELPPLLPRSAMGPSPSGQRRRRRASSTTDSSWRRPMEGARQTELKNRQTALVQ
ncbi:Hypothetical protein SMAX5B_008467, partial [Scophthalmus maximus]